MAVALVTGGGRGLGAAVATALAGRGQRVVVNYRADHDSARRVVDAITRSGGYATAAQADVTDEEETERLVAGVIADHGRLDVLVVNANTAPPPFAPLAELSWAAFAEKVTNELAGAFHVTKQALRHMTSGGRIVFVGSTAADYVGGGRLAHGVAKNALAVFARHVAAESARDGITVLTVAPGAVRTDATDSLLTGDRAAQLAEQSVLGRVLVPEDVAAAVAIAAGDELRAATGSTIRLDGGWSVLVGGPVASS
jgi:3-oxoacyl-[acyl-carrier protein] reductase